MMFIPLHMCFLVFSFILSHRRGIVMKNYLLPSLRRNRWSACTALHGRAQNYADPTDGSVIVRAQVHLLHTRRGMVMDEAPFGTPGVLPDTPAPGVPGDCSENGPLREGRQTGAQRPLFQPYAFDAAVVPTLPN